MVLQMYFERRAFDRCRRSELSFSAMPWFIAMLLDRTQIHSSFCGITVL
jgi:hypothetical protein